MGSTEEKLDYADTIQQDILHIWCNKWQCFFRRMVFKLGPLGILPQGWEKPTFDILFWVYQNSFRFYSWGYIL